MAAPGTVATRCGSSRQRNSNEIQVSAEAKGFAEREGFAYTIARVFPEAIVSESPIAVRPDDAPRRPQPRRAGRDGGNRGGGRPSIAVSGVLALTIAGFAAAGWFILHQQDQTQGQRTGPGRGWRAVAAPGGAAAHDRRDHDRGRQGHQRATHVLGIRGAQALGRYQQAQSEVDPGQSGRAEAPDLKHRRGAIHPQGAQERRGPRRGRVRPAAGR